MFLPLRVLLTGPLMIIMMGIKMVLGINVTVTPLITS